MGERRGRAGAAGPVTGPGGGAGAALQLARVRRVGDRLRSTLRAQVARLPEEARGISGMARHLRVHKATCQRLVEGLSGAGDGADAVTLLPGVQGLRLVIRAARGKGINGGTVEAAAAAVDEYEELLAELGATQRGLARLVGAAGRAAGGDEAGERVAVAHRRALYGAARDVTGESVEGKSSIFLARPDERDPARLRVAIVLSLAGARRAAFSRPIVPFIIGAGAAEGGAAGPEILPGFSTAGLRAAPLEGGAGRTAMVLELPPDPEGVPHAALGPADVAVRFTAGGKVNPLVDAGARVDFATRIAQPCRALVHDVLVPRELAAACRPVSGCFALSAPPGNTPEGAPERCWHDMFPEAAPVRAVKGRAVLSPPRLGGGAGAEALAERHAGLVRALLEREGVDAAGLVGLRMEVEYPVWQTEYRLYLSTPEQRGEGGGRGRR
jgi:hypothetical protein